jgi:hypothetical protein
MNASPQPRHDEAQDSAQRVENDLRAIERDEEHLRQVEVDLARDEEKLKHDLHEDRPSKKIDFTIVHEDSGREVQIDVTAHEKVEQVIDRGYRKLGLERQDGDRLRCETNGDSVFPHAGETVERFLQEEPGATTWLLTGPTGGA